MLTALPPQVAQVAQVAHAQQASPSEFLAFIVAYMELLLARWKCIDHGRSPREQPVPLCRFHELGTPDDILLWMLFHDHIEQ